MSSLSGTKRIMEIKPIGIIRTPFPQKFGIPRQSGLASAQGKIVLSQEYRVKEAFRGVEEFSHLWLIWGFSQADKKVWSPTVRPPRLGGNKRMGVFATRSPFRPNSLALSSVELERIDYTEKDGPVIYVKGVDMLDKTPIYDIKPYLSFTDSHPDARCGFASEHQDETSIVDIDENLLKKVDKSKQKSLIEILKQDPRPAYQDDSKRVYSMTCMGYEISFTADDNTIKVIDIKHEV